MHASRVKKRDKSIQFKKKGAASICYINQNYSEAAPFNRMQILQRTLR